MSTARITTPLPDGISAQDIVATLHNHGQMIKALCPNLIKYEMTDGQKDKIATYAVTDKKPIGEVRSVLVEACWQTGNGKTVYPLPEEWAGNGLVLICITRQRIG
jgi:hypothetical protein